MRVKYPLPEIDSKNQSPYYIPPLALLSRKSALPLDIVSIFRNNETMKKEVFELQAEICKTLANPKRLEIIACLKDGELSVKELAERLGVTKANVSQHLSVLRQRKVVTARRDGVIVYYRINNPKITEACALMKSVLLEQMQENNRLAKSIKAKE